jgi:pimeloyl-ACP methyl ester carboxylesterase
LGGVAPTQGPDAIGGGLVALGVRLSAILQRIRIPLGSFLGKAIQTAKPVASPALELYARVSPEGDRRLLEQADVKAMFLDDLFNGSRGNLYAPIDDVLAFTKDWGFVASDVKVPVVWWHGDRDQIIPYAHGVHMVERLPDAELRTVSGASHLAGLGISIEILRTLLAIWDSGKRSIAN